jgi:GH25 family lysozyme M1 (1,4-beta-N-acetylmuramidase)
MSGSAHGIDLSSYQAPLDSTYGMDFIIVKATEATSWTDPHFTRNWEFLRGKPARRGAYHFFHPSQPADEQAEFFVRTVSSSGLQPGDMLMADVEITAGADGRPLLKDSSRSHLLRTSLGGYAQLRPGVKYQHKLFQPGILRPFRDISLAGSTAAAFLAAVRAAADRVTGPGTCPVFIYSYLDFLPQLTPCTRWPLAVAAYGSTPPASVYPWDSWTFWQWSPGGGPLGADQDVFNGTSSDLARWAGDHSAPQWEVTMLNTLPVLTQGDTDKPGKVQFVHRVQALAAVVGEINGLPAARCLTATGTFDQATTAAVEAIQEFFRITKDGVVGPETWGCLVTGAPA